MDTSASQSDKKLGAFPFVIAGMSYFPAFGVLFGIAVILWGLLTKKKGGRTLALVGAGGIGFTFLLYGGLFYLSEHTGVFDKGWEAIAQSQLNRLVQSIEYYKVVHGTYPPSLEELKKAQHADHCT